MDAAVTTARTSATTPGCAPSVRVILVSPLAVLDQVVGVVLCVAGLMAWWRHRETWTGRILVVAGALWWLGYLLGPLVFAHRAALAQAAASYPTGRLPRWADRVLIAALYAVSIAAGVTDATLLTLTSGLLLVALGVGALLGGGGPAQRARRVPALLTVSLGAVVALGEANQHFDWRADALLLLTYDLVVAATGFALVVGLHRNRWATAVVTDLVTAAEPGPGLAAEIGRAAGDPSLEIGYLLEETGGYVDDRGRPVALPGRDDRRTVTPVDGPDGRVAVLIHDPAVLADDRLAEGIAAAARIAVTNARLQASIRVRVDELGGSRRRMVEVADRERARLVADLAETVQRRLLDVRSELLQPHKHRGDPTLVVAELDAATAELVAFAGGVRPPALARGGLSEAIPPLAARSTVLVATSVPAGRFPPAVEATAYFVCSEALANTAKHARARSASVTISSSAGWLAVEVGDDGVGHADARGAGLRRLADRVEALGGRLTVADRPSGGTRVAARLPIDQGWGEA